MPAMRKCEDAAQARGRCCLRGIALARAASSLPTSLLVLAPLLVLLAACGSGSAVPPASSGGQAVTSTTPSAGGGGAGAVPDPCALITRERIATVMGVDPGDPSSGRHALSRTGRSCAYTQIVTVVDLASEYQPLKEATEKDTGKQVEPVDGIGEEAFWDTESHTLAARGRAMYVSVAFIGPIDRDPAIQQGKEILATMLGNL